MDHTARLGQEKVLKLLLEFSVPALVGMLVSALYNVIDRIFIGNSAGSLGLAGITVGFPMMIIQFAFAGLVGIGATALVSIRLGQKKKEEAEQILGNAVVLLGIVSIVLPLIGLLYMDPILKLFGASNEVLPYARDYMRIILYGSAFGAYGFGLNSFIRAEGKPGIAMATMVIGTIVNVLLAPLFIFVFHWGMKGAAWATVIAQAVSSIWIVAYFLTGRSILKIHLHNLRLNLDVVKGISTIGFPFFLMQLSGSLLTAILNQKLAKFGGDVAISGMGIVNSILTLLTMPLVAVNQGGQPIIGYNYGAQKMDRVITTVKYSLIASTGIAVLGFLLAQLLPTQLATLFSGGDQALITMGSHMLRVMLLCMPIVGLSFVGSGYFLAIGKATQSTILSLSRQGLFLIPALLILPQFFGLQGVLAATPVADFLASVMTGTWLFVELRRQVRLHDENRLPILRDEDSLPEPEIAE